MMMQVSRNPQTGESRGSGFVTMGSINSAKNAIASLDMKEVGGREMRVRYSVEMNPGARRNSAALNSTPKKILMYESQYKVYVGNLPWSTQPDDLRDHFSSFGTVVSARVLHDRKTGKNRVFAFLSFASLEERDAALSLNGTVKLCLRVLNKRETPPLVAYYTTFSLNTKALYSLQEYEGRRIIVREGIERTES